MGIILCTLNVFFIILIIVLQNWNSLIFQIENSQTLWVPFDRVHILILGGKMLSLRDPETNASDSHSESLQNIGEIELSILISQKMNISQYPVFVILKMQELSRGSLYQTISR